MIDIRQHPAAGFLGYGLLLEATLVFALNTSIVYWLLYRRRKLPLETGAYYRLDIEVAVRVVVYADIALVAFLSLSAALRLLHLLRWIPLATSLFAVIAVLSAAVMLLVMRRKADADRLVSSPAS